MSGESDSSLKFLFELMLFRDIGTLLIVITDIVWFSLITTLSQNCLENKEKLAKIWTRSWYTAESKKKKTWESFLGKIRS